MISTPLDDAVDSIFTRGIERAEDFDRKDRLAFVWNSLRNRQASVPQGKLTIFVHMLDLKSYRGHVCAERSVSQHRQRWKQASQDVEQGFTTLSDNESIIRKP